MSDITINIKVDARRAIWKIRFIRLRMAMLRLSLWIKIFAFLLILTSCSEPDFCDCEKLRSVKQKAFDSWQLIVSHNHETDETRLGSEWDQESVAANRAYVSAYEMVKTHCE